MKFAWRLQQLMEERGWNETSTLRPHLAAQGVDLSREQVFRLVKYAPERLSMQTLVALCAIFGCTASDLIEVEEGDGGYRAAAPRRRSQKKPEPFIPITRVQLT